MKKILSLTLIMLFAFNYYSNAQTTKIQISSTTVCSPLYVTLYATDPTTCSVMTSLPIVIGTGASVMYKITDRSIWPGGILPGTAAVVDHVSASYCTGAPPAGAGTTTTGCKFFDYLMVGAPVCSGGLSTTSCFEDSGKSGCSTCSSGDIVNADYINNGTTVTIKLY